MHGGGRQFADDIQAPFERLVGGERERESSRKSFSASASASAQLAASDPAKPELVWAVDRPGVHPSRVASHVNNNSVEPVSSSVAFSGNLSSIPRLQRALSLLYKRPRSSLHQAGFQSHRSSIPSNVTTSPPQKRVSPYQTTTTHRNTTTKHHHVDLSQW